MSSESKDYLTLAINDIRNELLEIEKQLQSYTGLLAQKQNLETTLEELVNLREKWSQGLFPQQKPYKELSVLKATVFYLSKIGDFQETAAIKDELIRGGLRIPEGVDAYQYIYGTLRRALERKDPRIAKVGTKWGLQSFIPAPPSVNASIANDDDDDSKQANDDLDDNFL